MKHDIKRALAWLAAVAVLALAGYLAGRSLLTRLLVHAAFEALR